jgi:FMN phosphatase YigB (HAD superfamily)
VLLSLDLYNTLAREDQQRGADLRTGAIAAELADGWNDAAATAARRLLAGAQRRYRESWQAGTMYSPIAAATDVSRACVSLVGADPDRVPAVRDAILAAGGYELSPVEGAGELLERARSGGAQVCLVSDVGLTPGTGVLAFLRRCGVHDYFTAVSFSDQTGCYKPRPEAFLAAWTPAGYTDRPDQIVHVGDIHRNDVLGPTQLGVRAVRFAGVYDDRTAPDDGHPVVRRLLDVLVHLHGAAAGAGTTGDPDDPP